MKKAKLMVYVITFTAVTLFVSCGDEPAEPARSYWRFISRLPAEFSGVTGLLWIWDGAEACGYNEDLGTGFIYAYDGYGWNLEYTAPYTAAFEHMARGPYGTWAGGTKLVNDELVPFATRLNNNVNWREVTLPRLPNTYTSISGVIPVTEYFCWFLLTNHNPFDEMSEQLFGKHAGKLARFSGNGVTVYEDLPPVTGVWSEDEERFYAVEYAGDNTGPKPGGAGPRYQGRGHVFISSDRGDNWVTEEIPLYIGGREVWSAEAKVMAWPGQALIMTVIFEDEARGIVYRSGPPGAGVFKLVFLSPTGAYFANFNAFAVNDSPGNLGPFARVIGVGPRTTVVKNPDGWFVEPVAMDAELLEVDDIRIMGTGGFYAVSYFEPLRKFELLYHP